DLTMDCPLVVGRKTFESMPKSVWKTRTPFVLTSKSQIEHQGSIVIGSDLATLVDAATRYSPSGTAFIAGGSSLFEAAMGVNCLPLADMLIITHVKGEYEGDTKVDLDFQHFERRGT